MISVTQIIRQRRSIRDFESTEIDINIIRNILESAKFAPSNCNHQPWDVYVLSGSSKDKFSSSVIHAFETTSSSPNYSYFPSKWIAPYSTRRRDVGFLLYDTIGIDYEEREKIKQHHKRNFDFYGAPIGLIFTIDNSLQYGSFLDYGMFIQNIHLLCQEKGLATCTIGFFVEYPEPIEKELKLKPNQRIVCGMAIGYAKKDSVINSIQSSRESFDSFVHII